MLDSDLQWERIRSVGNGPIAKPIERAPVPNGWIIREGTRKGFIHDPEHEWQVESEPGRQTH